MTPETRTCILQAKTRIIRGWSKGIAVRYKADGKTPAAFCLTGALSYGVQVGTYLDAHRVVASLIPASYHGSLWHYNDHPGTTKANVLAVLAKALQAT